MPQILDEVLHLEPVQRVRANHALEHATLNVLESAGLRSPLAGVSDTAGFWIFGEISTQALMEAAREGLRRLQGGAGELAIHARCGTNVATSALLGGGLAWLGLRGKRKLSRLPLAVMLGALGYTLAKPLGPRIQQDITTSTEVGNLTVLGVKRHTLGSLTLHRVRIARGV